MKAPPQKTEATKTVFIAAAICAQPRALEDFLKAIPANSRITYTVLCAFAPDNIPECTLPVRIGASGLTLRSGEVVLIPYDAHLTLRGGTLVPSTANAGTPSDLANNFLQSISISMSPACAVILPDDCALDLSQSIPVLKTNGALIVLEKLDSRESSVEAEHLAPLADTALALAAIPKFLERFAKKKPLSEKSLLARKDVTLTERTNKLDTLVKRLTGFDLSAYKPESVSRRIARRMSICNVNTLALYTNHISENREEAEQLVRDMLIKVTRFFRDKEVFGRLSSTILPGMIKAAKNRPLRLWIPACATGEEVYSYAILIEEALIENGLPPDNFKIFATDLDRSSLAFASAGIYPRSLAETVPPHFLERYFTKSGTSYQIKGRIRERIVFAKHNILLDPPFTRIDLVSCRNLLIYLRPDAQKRVLSILNYALVQGGTLVLGQSESVGELGEQFALTDPKTHIFYKQQNLNTDIPDSFNLKNFHPIAPIADQMAIHHHQMDSSPSPLLEKFTNRILAHIDRTCFVLNDQHEILYSFGSPEKYTTIPKGRASTMLEELLPPELSIPFTTALGRVENGEPVRFGPIDLPGEKTKTSVSILVERMRLFNDQKDFTLVFIDEETRVKPVKKTDFDLQQSMLRISELKAELDFNKARLNSTLEELEASREELQSSNEELQASNEELQSTNEELESVNEELQSVNTEYQKKIQVLTQTNHDLDNFISSSNIATIFIDHDLHIRRFTPTAAGLTGLLPHDLGRLITDLSHPLLGEAADAARAILAGQQIVEKSIKNGPASQTILRANPYLLKNGSHTGAIISFIPLTT